MSYNIFIDDTRDPIHAYCADEKCNLIVLAGIIDWTIARDYNMFEFIVRKRGMPDSISFDHDLHFEHVQHYMKETVNTGKIDYSKFSYKTGKQCAELIMQMVRDGAKMPTCYVHSANEVGRIEINKVLYDK